LLGYVAGTPGLYLVGGSRQGTDVLLDFEGEDGDGIYDAGMFTGTLTREQLVGFFDDGSGPVPVTLVRSSAQLVEEHWLLIDADTSAMVEATRLLDGGTFLGGAFTGAGQCDFLACGGGIDAWNIAGTAHTIQTSSGGSCSTSSTLTGTLDPTSFLLMGTYTSTSCSSSASGSFMGGKRGLTNTSDVSHLLAMLARFCDALESESATAIEVLHSTYVHDGKTRADWAADFASWYTSYDSIEAIAELKQIITVDDGQVHAYLQGPSRMEWHLRVTGVPAGGGDAEVLLDYEPAMFADGLHAVGTEAGRWVFEGNGELEPFSINMPIAVGDGDLVTFGVWPYGAHGGGHPEGHPGMDIEYALGAKVRAAADGIVTYIGPNSNFPTQWDLLLEVRMGVVAQYDHMGAIDPSITVGTIVVEGQVLGDPSTPFPHSVVHFGVRAGLDTVCPVDFLTPAGQATFDSLWVTARYAEELIEPLACNPVDVSFPLTASRTLVSGSLPARVEFTRDDATTYTTTYALYDGTDAVIETGTANYNPFKTISEINLNPVSPAGPTRLGVLDIQGDDMWIDWDTTSRPTSLASASHYALDYTKVYVSNIFDGSISVLDLGTGTVTNTISVGTMPAHLAYSPALEMIFVGDLGASEINRVSTVTETVVLPSIPLANNVGAVDIDLATGMLYGLATPLEPAMGTEIHIIDGSSATEDPGSPISIGVNLQDIRVDRFNGVVYATDFGDGAPGSSGVIPFDTTTNTAGALIPIANSPHGLALDAAAGLLYVTQVGGDSVSVINTASGAEVESILVGTDPEWVALNADGSKAYVTNRGDGTVSIIAYDGITWSVNGTITVGTEPFFVTVDKISNKAIVTNHGSDTVTIIDMISDRVIATIDVGDGPVGATFVRYNL
ncbi:MAG: peptidoglycan DD-metalloendopeptidase family protein, partial [Planctomycetota bacterium]|nr:peptidoglycan DD-metalloendopeptidase family protein [Planctomycetota bacterium]